MNIGTVEVPVYVRVGNGEEIEIGTFTFDLNAGPAKADDAGNAVITIGTFDAKITDSVLRRATAIAGMTA